MRLTLSHYNSMTYAYFPVNGELITHGRYMPSVRPTFGDVKKELYQIY